MRHRFTTCADRPREDHVTRWRFQREQAVYVSQPYDLHPEELVDYARAHGLEVRIDAADSWHYPGWTFLVAFARPEMWKRLDEYRDGTRRGAKMPPRKRGRCSRCGVGSWGRDEGDLLHMSWCDFHQAYQDGDAAEWVDRYGNPFTWEDGKDGEEGAK
jgi:hypothetical protein